MSLFRVLRGSLAIAGGLIGAGIGLPGRVDAQGVTTTLIRGAVRMADGSAADGGRVVVRSDATGFAAEAEVRRGRFLVQGLEAGGPYTVTVRRIGTVAWRQDGILLTLGEPLELQVTLEPAAVVLDTLVVSAPDPVPPALGHGGTAATLADSLVHRLPSLNRDVYDFLRLVPQVSTRIGLAAGGMSGGGVGFRLNQFLTNGVPERSLAGGQPPEFAGGRSLPFEAVREYQVLLAPFDVRYGDFAGAMVNTVTRSGTNRWGGSAFAQGRSDDLARGGSLAGPPYQRWQYGASLSGPILRDRAHFYAAAELQDLTAPMAGPWVGQAADASSPVPVTESDVTRLTQELGAYGLTAGSGGPVSNRNQVRNVFLRVDAALPRWNTRAMLWFNDSDVRNLAYSRQASPDTFQLTSYQAAAKFGTRTLALQLNTTLRRPAGGYNEFSLSRRSIPFRSVPEVRQPIVRVAVPSTSGGLTTVVTGAPAQSQGGEMRTWSVSLTDALTLPLGASHAASLGMETEWFRAGPGGVANSLGTWTFRSLDSLAAGLADRYELARDFGSGSVPISGTQVAAFAGDHWRVSDRLALTVGLRAERLAIDQRPPYNAMVDSLFGLRTDATFSHLIHFSPRIGFTWALAAESRDQLRGGLGLFTGRPPLAWLHTPLQNYGEGIGTLRCGSLPGDLGPPPPFNPDPANPPVTCAGGQGLSGPPRGDVELIAPDLRMARTLRGALAYERRLPGQLVGTVEALVTRNVSDYAFVNLNLAGPVGTDRHGRVLYGSLDSLGRARPARITDSLPSVIELRNVSRNHGVSLAVSLARPFLAGISVMASYTWSRFRDVQTPLRINTRGSLNWASRAVSGYHDLSPGISLNDVPHRVVLAGTWRAPWTKWVTELSLLYVGESGSPFTYLAGGAGGLGDLNADGALNDPIYVPRDARDPNEIQFSGVSSEPGADNSPAAQDARIQVQRAAFEQFIHRTACLRERRGRIAVRNGCREPWTHTTVASLRQAIPVGGGALDVQLDVYNVLNLLDREWGQHRVVTSPALLEQVGVAIGPSGQQEPVFRFAANAAGWRADPAESAFQFQFGVRYRF
jgi:hypothetical protein